MKEPAKDCPDNTPPWFVGHWRDWHRGHGCNKDDGKPRSEAATTEITQHAANADTDFLTDAELSFLRASTTSGNTLFVRALNELAARRAENARLAADLRRVCQRIVAESDVNKLFAETSGKALPEQLAIQAERADLRDENTALRTLFAEALDLFDATWCPEHGHAPKPQQIKRAAELRKLLNGVASSKAKP